MDLGQSTYLNWLMQEEQTRQDLVRLYRQYYDGDFPSLLTERMAAFLNVDARKPFGVNLCAVVVDTEAERLHVSGFSAKRKTGGEADPDTEVILQNWWENGRMDAVQGWTHTAALRDSEAYALVEYDPEAKAPKICHDFSYDGTSGVKVHYEPGTYNKMACASKRWVIDGGPMAGKVKRLNLYFPNRIEKWVCKYPDSQHSEAMWMPYVDEYDPTLKIEVVTDEHGRTYQAAVSWWTDNGTATGEPLGVPVIAFINRNDGAGRGISEIDNIIPLQNAANKTFIDLAAVADSTGFQMIYTVDANIPSGGLKFYPGAVINLASQGDTPATAGTLPPGDASGLLAYFNNIITVASGISATPQSRFTPSAVKPAEGTQKQEESALVAKVERAQRVFGNAWEDVMYMALKVNAAFGDGVLDDDILLSAQWASAQTRNELEEVNTAAIKAEKLGVPVEQLWLEIGYSNAEIKAFKLQRAKEQAKVRVASAEAKLKQAADMQGQQQAGQPSDEMGDTGQNQQGSMTGGASDNPPQ